MKFCLLLCMVTACNTSRFGSEEDKEKKPAVEEDDAEVESSNQKIDPIITDRPLDILLVIDNSFSMDAVHENLSNNLRPLLQKVKDSDWRIVITTATFTDCLRAVINKGDNNHETAFVNTINGLKNTQSEESNLTNTEDTVRMAFKALPFGSPLQYSLPLRSLGHDIDRVAYDNRYDDRSFFSTRRTWCTGDVNHQDNGEKRAHWLRDGSMLAILLITDEDAYSGDTTELDCGCKFRDVPPAGTIDPRSCKCIDDLWGRISDVRTPKVTAKIYGLLKYDLADFYLGWRSKDGKELFDASSDVDNTNKDFDKVLNEISTNVAEQMKKTYSLNRFHDGKTSKVTFKYKNKPSKQLPATAYRIEGRTLIFTENPPTDVEGIEVTFSYSR